MSIALGQILALVGKLDDGQGEDTPRERFRRFLRENVLDVGNIRDYIGECLRTSGDQYSRALQDLVNYLGHFLGFDVIFGRYQGVSNQLGFDGHWVSPTGFHVVVEVKTTDVYAIKTKTLVGYIDGLISEKKIPSWDQALGLYIVGRPDGELRQLENAIVAEKRTDQLRILAVESLLALAEMISDYDVGHQDILALLEPSGPRIDPVVDLIARLLASKPATVTQSPVSIVRESPATPAVLAADVVQTMEVEERETPLLEIGSESFWLTPVRSEDEETAEQCVARLVGREHMYAFGERTPGRKHLKPGDWICFYATTKGVVAHAMVASRPEKRPDARVRQGERFPWTFCLEKVVLYTTDPVIVDGDMRGQLDAFKDHDLRQSWAWFVQATHRLSEHDFRLLTRDQ
jgi:hypothetical protein